MNEFDGAHRDVDVCQQCTHYGNRTQLGDPLQLGIELLHRLRRVGAGMCGVGRQLLQGLPVTESGNADVSRIRGPRLLLDPLQGEARGEDREKVMP